MMATIANRMLASLLAEHLQEELDAASEGGSNCTLASASHALHPADVARLRLAMEKQLAKLLKEADGCPPRIFKWREFFAKEAF